MESSEHHMLQKYRDDRRKLLQFLVSSGFIKEVRTPAGPTTSFSSINFDSLSTDYVLECIKSGGVLDVSQARKRYYDESSYPTVMHMQSRDIFYLKSDANLMTYPPCREPPSIMRKHADFSELHSSGLPCNPDVDHSPMPVQETGMNCQVTTAPDLNPSNCSIVLATGLPKLKKGLLDDDLRESAYEVFLASILLSGVEMQTTDCKTKGKSARYLSGLKSRKDKRHVEPESPVGNSKILETIRVQMQISESTDIFVRRRLSQFASGKPSGDIDVPQVSLALLTGISRTDFSSEKSYIHWKNRQANVLEELLFFDHKKNENQKIGASLAKIRNPEEWDLKMSPSERSDFLLTIRQVALAFSTIPGRFGIEGETYYWTAGYHLNIRLYEKMLHCLFDILEDDKLIEETEEILNYMKLTWSMLGITERLHHALFAWVLFQQFVTTQEISLLDHAIVEVEKVLSAEVSDDKEVAYTKSLMCSAFCDGYERRLNLLQSIFLSISLWCDSKLHDYHLHFSQKNSFFERVIRMGLSVAVRDFVSLGSIRVLTGVGHSSELVMEKVRGYVEKSLDVACKRVTYLPTFESVKEKAHPLAVLANEIKMIAEKDLSIFIPVLCQFYPECAVISSKLLHKFYGERLKPFLDAVTNLTENTREVLSAAFSLESCLIELHSFVSKDNKSHSINDEEFCYYPIAEISRPIIVDWIIAQHERIMEWTGRAFDLEKWEPLSSQQKQAASAVEVFRIIEETVDQFFGLGLPLDITHLQAVLSIIFHSLDAYLLKVVSQLVEKEKLYPSIPPLTRYKEVAFLTVKKKVVECSILDDEIYKQLDELETSKLCIRLNTCQYIQKQTTVLEEGIRKSWEAIRSFQKHRWQKRPKILESLIDFSDESISELFVATLDCIRDSAAHTIRKISDFLGTKFVFWDLRDSFLFYLYHGDVEANRMDGVLTQFDRDLNNACCLIDETIRDLVVLSIYKASMEGFMWVLLDGGPFRSFSDKDIAMIEEDLSVLKDLFVADGEGLPRSLVEEESKLSHQILSLFSIQTESLIQMLMSSSEHISIDVANRTCTQRRLGDAETLIRVLCHKKDQGASKFLKRHYQLPSSSGYGEKSVEDSSFHSPLFADIVKRSASFRWSEKGHSSFGSIKKKFYETRWDMKHIAW